MLGRICSTVRYVFHRQLFGKQSANQSDSQHKCRRRASDWLHLGDMPLQYVFPVCHDSVSIGKDCVSALYIRSVYRTHHRASEPNQKDGDRRSTGAIPQPLSMGVRVGARGSLQNWESKYNKDYLSS